MMHRISILLISIFFFNTLQAEDGYKLWLRYDPVSDPQLFDHYNKYVSGFMIEGSSSTLLASGEEMKTGLGLMLDSREIAVNYRYTDIPGISM